MDDSDVGILNVIVRDGRGTKVDVVAVNNDTV